MDLVKFKMFRARSSKSGCAIVVSSESADRNGSDVPCKSSVLLKLSPLECIGMTIYSFE